MTKSEVNRGANWIEDLERTVLPVCINTLRDSCKNHQNAFLHLWCLPNTFHPFLLQKTTTEPRCRSHLKGCLYQWPSEKPHHCWQFREPDRLIVYTCTQSRSGITSWKTPLELYPDWMSFHKRLRFHPWSFSLHHDNSSCCPWHISPTPSQKKNSNPSTSTILATLHSTG